MQPISNLRLPFLAFLGRDACLSIIRAGDNAKLGNDQQLQPLEWYKIDPDSGRFLAEAHKHSCGVPMDRLHHAGSGRVLAMVDASNMAVLDADTLQKISSFATSHQHPVLARQLIPCLGDVRWCHDGSMLAVLLLHNLRVQSATDAWTPYLVAEVHVYDAVSGVCLASLQLQASLISVSCSKMTNLVAIFFDRQVVYDRARSARADHSPHLNQDARVHGRIKLRGKLAVNSSGASSHTLLPAVDIRSDVRMVDPVTQQVELIPHLQVEPRPFYDVARPSRCGPVSCTSADQPNAVLKSCGWTPCGDMLLGT